MLYSVEYGKNILLSFCILKRKKDSFNGFKSLIMFESLLFKSKTKQIITT